MELHVFRLFVTCYLTCVLCKNAVGESTNVKIFPSINNAFQLGARISEIDNTRIEQSTETETRLDGISLKNDSLETSREFPLVQDLSMKTKILNDFKEVECSRYCVQQLATGKGFEDINLVFSFADQNGEDYFSLENNPNLRILRHTSIDNQNSIVLDNCQIYLNLDCNIANIKRNLVIPNNEFSSNLKFNRPNIDIFKNYFSNTTPEFSKKLIYRTDLSGYTETNFQIDANVTGIAINTLGNLTRVVLIIPTNKMIERPGIVMSSTSTYNAKGVTIAARNLPGRWYVKLTGAENSKYNFDVTVYYGANMEDNMKNDNIDTNFTNEINKKEDMYEVLNEKRTTQSKASTVINKIKFNELDQETRKNITNNDLFLINPTIKQKFVFERSAEIMDTRRSNDEIMADNFSDTSLSSRESTATIDKKIINFVLHNNSLMSYGEFKILPNNKEQKIQARSLEISSLNEDVMNDEKMKSSLSETVTIQMADSDQSQKLSTQVNEDSLERRRILLDVNANSRLIAAPGTIHRVIFDATNNCLLPVRYAIQARSSPFRVYQSIQPIYVWLYPGQTDQIAIDILIPSGTQDTVNTLTVRIIGTEIADKTVYIYVQNAFSKNIDNVKPTIEYWFNNNCAGKLDKDRCEKTLWSADITVQDYDSGLKRVTAIPNGLYLRTKYVSGTKDRVTFYYSATCCTTSATIIATDMLENQHTRTIDVTTWDNLSQGEIAAIVLGVLFLLLLIILLIVAIVYCVRKKNSHDLPYTQRYASSRQPARAERTSF